MKNISLVLMAFTFPLIISASEALEDQSSETVQIQTVNGETVTVEKETVLKTAKIIERSKQSDPLGKKLNKPQRYQAYQPGYR